VSECILKYVLPEVFSENPEKRERKKRDICFHSVYNISSSLQGLHNLSFVRLLASLRTSNWVAQANASDLYREAFGLRLDQGYRLPRLTVLADFLSLTNVIYNILQRTDPLLGKDLETNNETTALLCSGTVNTPLQEYSY
jgi:hypothetical protein